MPPHLHYVEPFAGGLAVLLAKDPEGISEVVNDRNAGLINFWCVLRNPSFFAEFVRYAEATPFSEEIYREASAAIDFYSGLGEVTDEEWTRWAYCFFVCCRMSLAGRMQGFTGVTKTRTRRGMDNEVSAWLTAVEGLPAVHERLKRVLILNRDALDVIRGQDGEQTLYYCDPPYIHSTRATTGEYAHEMSEAQHKELLDTLAGIKGKFLLSGYRSPLYDEHATRHGWHRHDIEIANHAAGGKDKRVMVESLWANFALEGKGCDPR